MSDSPPRAEQFEDVDLTGAATDNDIWKWNWIGFLIGLIALGAGFAYEHFGQQSLPFFQQLEPIDWLLAVSLLAMAAFLIFPLATNREQAAQYWRRLQNRRFGVLSLLILVALFLVGLFGPLFVSEPTRLYLARINQPPVFTSVSMEWLSSCVGDVSGGMCYGTWQFPFGTTRVGRDLLPYVVLGARTTLVIAVVSATLIVPTGLLVGLVAAYSSSRVDSVLMRLAEVLQTIPAFIIYLLFWSWNAEYRLLMLVTVFGLTNWGGLARLVRNEALQLRERPYIKAAQLGGASKAQIIRQHLLPNISRPVLANVTLQLPLLIITEAALSFVVLPAYPSGPVTLGDPTVVSWGQVIYMGIRDVGLFPAWWVTAIPSVFLVLTVLTINVFGRSLSDVLDIQSGW